MKKLLKGVFVNRNKPLYIATKQTPIFDDYGNEIITYSTPVYIGRFNYEPLYNSVSLYNEMAEYGEIKHKLVRAFIDIKHRGKIHDFDLAYLYGATPTNEITNGANANYEVRTVIEQNSRILVIFEEIVKEG